jgi:hypothetical protein
VRGRVCRLRSRCGAAGTRRKGEVASAARAERAAGTLRVHPWVPSAAAVVVPASAAALPDCLNGPQRASQAPPSIAVAGVPPETDDPRGQCTILSDPPPLPPVPPSRTAPVPQLLIDVSYNGVSGTLPVEWGEPKAGHAQAYPSAFPSLQLLALEGNNLSGGCGSLMGVCAWGKRGGGGAAGGGGGCVCVQEKGGGCGRTIAATARMGVYGVCACVSGGRGGGSGRAGGGYTGVS